MRALFKSVRESQAGSSLLEVLFATALLSTVAVGLFQGLAVVTKSDIIVTGLSVAESLARSELEYVRTSTYIDYGIEEHPTYGTIPLPEDYTMSVAVAPLAISTGEPLDAGQDEGLQRITVTVDYRGETVTSLAGYRAGP
jgi:hypothetical protein